MRNICRVFALLTFSTFMIISWGKNVKNNDFFDVENAPTSNDYIGEQLSKPVGNKEDERNLSGSLQALKERAEAYFEADDYQKAADLYSQYISDPKHDLADESRYSVILYFNDDYIKSLQVANKILNRDSNNFQALRLRMINEVALEQYSDAVLHGEEFFSKFPIKYFSEIDFSSLADAYIGTDQYEKAIEICRQGLNVFPDSEDLFFDLSSAYSQNKQFKKAAEAYDKYLNLNEKPSLNDFFTASGKWLNVAATAGGDLELRSIASSNGLKYVERILPEVQETQLPIILERKAYLQTAANEDNRPDKLATQTFIELINIIESDPQKLNPNYSNNEIKTYRNACALIYQYYKDIDESLAQKYAEKYRQFSGATK